MILSARFLDNYVDANNYDYVNTVTITTSYPPVPGQAVTLTLQLLDLSKDKTTAGFSPAGRRFVSPVDAKLQVQFTSINQAATCTYTAVQDSNDRSIWSVQVPESDLGKLRSGTWSILGNLRLSTTSMVRFQVPNAINILPQNDFN
jgi:hypothetical protein